jgi:hypothetical protein
MWPPDEAEWRELLRDLPPDLSDKERRAVQEAIEAAVREYIDDADRDEQLRSAYLQIKRVADSRQIQKLCQAILQLRDFPLDPGTEAMLRQAEALARICSEADLRASLYLSMERRSRFMSRLSLAWTGPGRGDLPTSETGSFVDFMVAITGRVFPRPLDGSGIKRFVSREKARRATLRILNQILTGQGGMKADAFLIDEAGQRKPD